tara:strand:+ start:1994 stop:3832 length:1839 start_codon:yes stop_codon:yes gene_type:complete
MCAIAGFVGNREYLPKSKNISQCLKIMKSRRGPDSAESYIYKNDNFSFAFLQARLSIIDPNPRSKQPMEDEEGIISFSGEIYNYVEVKKICLAKGASFKTKSDTEVLLKSLNLFGEKALELLDGDWAFSYFNKKLKRVIISRDRFSIKPLFYYKKNNNFYFASNINHLFLLIGEKFEIDITKVKSFLNFGFKAFSSEPKTFFSNVFNFPGSSYITIEKNNLSDPKKFWKPKIKIDERLSYNESVEIVKNKLIESTKLRLRSDFPITCLLSGGLDSSAISGISKNFFGKDLRYFSYKPKNKNYDETNLINENLKSLNGDHTFVELDFNDSLQELKNLVVDGGSPLNSLSSFAFHRLCKEIKNNDYRVVLSGVGGDELFAGNYIDHLNYLVSVKDKSIFQKAFKNWETKIKPIIRSPILKDYESFLKKVENNDNATWHERDLIKSFLNFDLEKNNLKKEYYSNDFFRNELSRCLFEENVPSHLFSMDQIAMYHSIESRYPFLSPDLYEAVNTIPSEFLMKSSLSKSILRDSLKDNVPDKVLSSNNKIGFYCDIAEIFETNSKKFQDLLFNNSKLNSLVNTKLFKNLLEKKAIDVPELKLIFNFLNLATLYEAYD